MSNPKVRIGQIKMVKVAELKPHPDNPNDHSEKQITQLAKIIEYQGWRYPIKVSNQSGLITTGHGRRLAALMKCWDEVPVDFQDYDDETQEIADVLADNAIATQAEIDMSDVNGLLEKIGPIDLDLLGFKDLVIDPSEFDQNTDGRSLSDRFMIPPFTVLNAREGWWQARKRQWISLGIKSELGRGGGRAAQPGTSEPMAENTDSETARQRDSETAR